MGHCGSFAFALLACLGQGRAAETVGSICVAQGCWSEPAGRVSLLQQGVRGAQRVSEAGSKVTSQDPLLSDKPPPCQAKTVINAGLPRTSTASWAVWVNQLGYESIHHSPRLKLRSDNYEHFWDLLPAVPTAFSDAPWALEACLIAARRPESVPKKDLKFINFRRNATAWYKSLKHMSCVYRGAGFNSDTCAIAQEPSLEQGQSISLAPGVWSDVAMSYRPTFINLALWLKDRWCHRAGQDVEAFCAKEEDPQDSHVQLDLNITAKFMENFRLKLRDCIGTHNLLELDVEDPKKEQKMADFLGCKGEIPRYPLPSDTDHI